MLAIRLTAILILSLLAPKIAAQELPRFNSGHMTRESQLATFVDAFIEADSQARQLLNPSNRTLFAQGYRPTVGVPHDPEAKRERFTDLRAYFIRKLHLDLNALRPPDQRQFRSFLEQLGQGSDRTLMCVSVASINGVWRGAGRGGAVGGTG